MRARARAPPYVRTGASRANRCAVDVGIRRVFTLGARALFAARRCDTRALRGHLYFVLPSLFFLFNERAVSRGTWDFFWVCLTESSESLWIFANGSFFSRLGILRSIKNQFGVNDNSGRLEIRCEILFKKAMRRKWNFNSYDRTTHLFYLLAFFDLQHF